MGLSVCVVCSSRSFTLSLMKLSIVIPKYRREFGDGVAPLLLLMKSLLSMISSYASEHTIFD